LSGDVLNAAENGVIFEISDFAASALEKWRAEERYRELKKHHGNAE